MATAKRLYLYGVSAAGIGMLVSAAAVLLHLLLNKAGIGPQIAGSSTAIGNADRDLLSVAIPVGIIGLILWLTHWGTLERIVHRADETAAAERASIVRSVFFAVALSATLLAAASLGEDLLTKSLSNIIDPAKVSRSSSGFTLTAGSFSVLVGDAWSLAVIIMAFGVWAYHAWIRARDLRQGSYIGGAAAWISRFYLYGAALLGLGSMIVAVSAIITTFGRELFKEPTASSVTPSGNPIWLRAVIALLVSLVIWTIVWLIHWLYSNRLRSGRGTATEQNLAERSSRVRLAYITSLVFIGAIIVISSLAMSLGFLFLKLLGYEMTSAQLGYFLVVPPLAAVPVAVVWFLHRRRGIDESAQNQDGISGRRIAAYLTVIAAIYELAFGAASALGAVFGEWFAVRGHSSTCSSCTSSFESWKYSFAIGLGALLVGFAFWVWPWFTSQRRRRSEGEIGSASRSYYLYLVVGTSILILAGTLAWILYRYLRVAFGLPEANLGPEISMTLALALVAALLFVYHGLVLRGDSKPRQYQPAGLSAWPGYPGPVAYPPAAPMYAPPGAYQPAPPAWQPAPMPPVAPAPAALEATPPSDAKPEAGA